MSESTTTTVPLKTDIPRAPHSVEAYIDSVHLNYLKELFYDKCDSVVAQQEEDAKARRGRRGRQRRRRGSSPLPSALDDAEDEEIFKRKADLPFSLDVDRHPIDRAHKRRFKYHLQPGDDRDAYYYGPYPGPPAKVVRTVLRAAALPPVFDPSGLSASQLHSTASTIFDRYDRLPSTATLEQAASQSKEASREGQEPATASNSSSKRARNLYFEDDGDEDSVRENWETNIIANFSNACDANIALNLDKLPLSKRPILATSSSGPSASAMSAIAHHQQQPYSQAPPGPGMMGGALGQQHLTASALASAAGPTPATQYGSRFGR